MSSGLNSLYPKDPNDVVDYTVNWSRYLNRVDDVILISGWIVPDGIEMETETSNDTLATVWLSGGTAGVSYNLTNRITTAGGRQLDKTITIRVRNL